MADNSTESQTGMSQSRDSRTMVLSAGCFRVVGEIWNCCQRGLDLSTRLGKRGASSKEVLALTMLT